MADADFLVGYVDAAVKDALFQTAPKLKLVQLLSAGYDRADIMSAGRAKVPVSNNGGANATAVSEHAILLMLAVSRRLIQQHANVSGGRWRGNNVPRVHEVNSRTMGIVGLGTIGKKTARLALGFGMNVQYYDVARLTEDQEQTLGVRFRLLNEILRTSDVVSLHVPLNESTHHLIGAAELALMKPDAVLVNTARGPVIDEVGADRRTRGRQAGRGRSRRARPGAAAARQSVVRSRQCRAHGTPRRADVGEQPRKAAQRLRQCAAGGARRAAALGCSRAAGLTAALSSASVYAAGQSAPR